MGTIVCKIMRGSTVAILLLGLGCFLLLDPVRGSPIEVGEEAEGDDKLPEDDDGGEEDEEKDDEEDEDEDVINEKLGCVIEEGTDYKDDPIKSETTGTRRNVPTSLLQHQKDFSGRGIRTTRCALSNMQRGSWKKSTMQCQATENVDAS